MFLIEPKFQIHQIYLKMVLVVRFRKPGASRLVLSVKRLALLLLLIVISTLIIEIVTTIMIAAIVVTITTIICCCV